MFFIKNREPQKSGELKNLIVGGNALPPFALENLHPITAPSPRPIRGLELYLDGEHEMQPCWVSDERIYNCYVRPHRNHRAGKMVTWKAVTSRQNVTLYVSARSSTTVRVTLI